MAIFHIPPKQIIKIHQDDGVTGWTVYSQIPMLISQALDLGMRLCFEAEIWRGDWVKMRSLGWILIQYAWYPHRKRRWGHRHAWKKGPVRHREKLATFLSLQAKKRGLRRNFLCWHPDLSQSPENKFLLFEPGSVWYFVMAAPGTAHQGTCVWGVLYSKWNINTETNESSWTTTPRGGWGRKELT